MRERYRFMVRSDAASVLGVWVNTALVAFGWVRHTILTGASVAGLDTLELL